MKALKRIGLIAYDRKKPLLKCVEPILSDPDFDGYEFYQGAEGIAFPYARVKKLKPAAFLKKIDVLVSFGGDGSFISAVRLVAKTGLPLVGVNMGGLGFLTDIPATRAREELKRIFRGSYTREKRMMFDVVLQRKGRLVVRDICLNDSVIKGNKLFNLAVHHGSESLSAYNADGMIVSTPTGSTAYSMASGGPIVHPVMDCAIITPICSHSLTQKPIVCPVRKPLRLQICDSKARTMLSIDGKNNIPLKSNDAVIISRARQVATLLKPRGITYYGILREKLSWGKD